MKRHDLDLTSLVAGVVFMAVGGAFLLDLLYDLSLDPRWLAPLVLIGVGVAGLLSALPDRQADGDSARADDPVDVTIDA